MVLRPAFAQQVDQRSFSASKTEYIPASEGAEVNTLFRLTHHDHPNVAEFSLPLTVGFAHPVFVIDEANAPTFGIDWAQLEAAFLNPSEMKVETEIVLPGGAFDRRSELLFSPPDWTELLRLEVNRTSRILNEDAGWRYTQASVSFTAFFNAIPEPSALTMAGSCLVGFGLTRRRGRLTVRPPSIPQFSTPPASSIQQRGARPEARGLSSDHRGSQPPLSASVSSL
jgi:hypothetical protein